jgi:hypothetical protein
MCLCGCFARLHRTRVRLSVLVLCLRLHIHVCVAVYLRLCVLVFDAFFWIVLSREEGLESLIWKERRRGKFTTRRTTSVLLFIELLCSFLFPPGSRLDGTTIWKTNRQSMFVSHWTQVVERAVLLSAAVLFELSAVCPSLFA